MELVDVWLENFKEVVADEISKSGGKASDGYRLVANKTGIAYDYIYQMYAGKPVNNPKKPSKTVAQAFDLAYRNGRAEGWFSSRNYKFVCEPPELNFVEAEKPPQFSKAAEALAKMFDRVPTDDALAWATLYHSLVQAISAQIPAQTQPLQQGLEKQPSESRMLQETHKTAK